MTIRPGGNGGHLRQQANDVCAAFFVVTDVFGLGVKRRQRADGGNEHIHRMGVIAKPIHELANVFVQEGMGHHFLDPIVELRATREFALEQQIGHLQKRGLLRQCLNGIPAVIENPGLAVDEGDGTFARRGVHERGIVRHQAKIGGVGLDLTQVHRANRAVFHGHLVGLLGAIVGDRQAILRHGAWLCAAPARGQAQPTEGSGLPVRSRALRRLRRAS